VKRALILRHEAEECVRPGEVEAKNAMDKIYGTKKQKLFRLM
jgi:hypothetical protein